MCLADSFKYPSRCDWRCSHDREWCIRRVQNNSVGRCHVEIFVRPMRYKGCHQAHNAQVVMCALFATRNSLKLQGRRKVFFTHSQSSCHIAKVVPALRHDSRQIPIASDAPPRHTSRGFLHWRFADAGSVSAAPPSWGRHPQTFTKTEVAQNWNGRLFRQRSSSGSPHASFCEREVLYGGGRRHTQGRFGCRVNRPLQPYLSFLNRWMDSLVLCFWHRLDQQRDLLAEACGAGRFASIVPETHHDEIVRGNHQRRLPAGARHVIGIARDWISPVAVEPKESSIDRPIFRGPGGRKRPDEFVIALWENALTVPHATLKKEVPKPRPVAPGANLITLP